MPESRLNTTSVKVGIVAAVVAILFGGGLLPTLAGLVSDVRHRDDAPITVQVSHEYREQGTMCSGLVSDHGPSEIPPPHDDSDIDAWLDEQDGADAGVSRVKLVIQGGEEASVVLTGLSIDVQERQPAPARFSYVMTAGCGGGVSPRYFSVDLEKAHPTVDPQPGHTGNGQTEPAIEFPYKINAIDPEVFLIVAGVEHNAVMWSMTLHYVAAGTAKTLKIDDDGQPFQTSADGASRTFQWVPGTDKWTEIG